MKKKGVSIKRLNNLLNDWRWMKPTLEAGYPYYGTPKLVNRTIKLLKELKNEYESK